MVIAWNLTHSQTLERMNKNEDKGNEVDLYAKWNKRRVDLFHL